MKRIYQYKSLAYYILIALICNLGFVNAFADTMAKKARVRMKMYYFKEEDGQRKINIALTAGSGRNMHGVKDAEVVITSELNDSTIVLATVETDTLGEISLYLAADYVLPVDEDGKCVLEASYEGNDEYRSASNDIEVMDIDLKFDFEVEDSVKYLNITATRIDGEGNEVPVEELGINIGVQRLFSVLPLEEIETDEDGLAVLEISDDLPGDSEGNLTFVAFIEDHDEFGTVTKKAEHNWGLAVDYEIKPLPKQLFTDEAPLWMIVSVFVILLGAWYHFFLSISKLIKLKKAGDAV